MEVALKKQSAAVAALKIFLITLIVSAGISVIANLFLEDLGLVPAIIVVIVLIALGIIFDIIGVAFTSCDEKPFVAMSAKKMGKARTALVLIKKADVVANVCNDVIGDICGIVSGAAGTAIVVKILGSSPTTSEFVLTIAVSALTAAFTVGGKMYGKSYALKNNIKIVETVGSLLSIFDKNVDKKSDKKKDEQ